MSRQMSAEAGRGHHSSPGSLARSWVTPQLALRVAGSSTATAVSSRPRLLARSDQPMANR
jgi:hypothetical protein